MSPVGNALPDRVTRKKEWMRAARAAGRYKATSEDQRRWREASGFRAKRAAYWKRHVADPIVRLKDQVRRATRRAISRGEIQRGPCRDCGAVKAQAHHEDYTKPLDIVWLCVRCHRAHHERAAR